MREFLFAVLFLTRIPVASPEVMPDAGSQGRSTLYYPLVGLLIGCLLCFSYYLLSDLTGSLKPALILALWVGITGALHLDGLADLADAWIGGGGDRGRTLDIMKDSRSGPVAVTVLVLLLLIKFSALETLSMDHQWSVLLVAPIVGRSALLAALCYIPYARAGGIGEVLADNLPRKKVLWVLSGSILPIPLLWGWDGLLAVMLVVAGFLLLKRALINRIGGITGDAAGAICELLEAVFLVCLALLL
ncbi:MAG: adenosylcobinamide-GDP ribazoletransferase [Gammaproteobacteria bacterium]|nr:adenosylcobinamide-GDP ribazoletransferase [Gammaproteobacteria bacterium]